jgi:tRNA(Ser,Leu) C12 N-acetylase TAN1
MEINEISLSNRIIPEEDRQRKNQTSMTTRVSEVLNVEIDSQHEFLY